MFYLLGGTGGTASPWDLLYNTCIVDPRYNIIIIFLGGRGTKIKK